MVGVELRPYALALSRDAMTKMHKSKECVVWLQHISFMLAPFQRKLRAFVRNLNAPFCAAFCACPLLPVHML